MNLDLDALARRLADSPDDGNLHATLGFRLLSDGGDELRALIHLREASRLYAAAFADPRSEYQSQSQIIRHLEALGGNQRAFEAARAAAAGGAFDPEERHRLLARCAACLGLFATYAFGRDDLDALGAERQRAVSRAPGDAVARFQWSAVLAAKGRLNDAIAELRVYRQLESARNEVVHKVAVLEQVLLSLRELDELAAEGRAESWQAPDLAALRSEAERSLAAARLEPDAAGDDEDDVRARRHAREQERVAAERIAAARTEAEQPPSPPAKPAAPPQPSEVVRLVYGVAFGALDEPPWGGEEDGDADEDWTERWRRLGGDAERTCSVVVFGRPGHFSKYAAVVDDSVVEATTRRPSRFAAPKSRPEWPGRLQGFCDVMGIPCRDPGWHLLATRDG